MRKKGKYKSGRGVGNMGDQGGKGREDIDIDDMGMLDYGSEEGDV